MRFFVCRTYGTDDHQWCGFVDANSLDEVVDREIWRDGKAERSALEWEFPLTELRIIPAECVNQIDLEPHRIAVSEFRKAEARRQEEEIERAEYARLKSKYG